MKSISIQPKPFDTGAELSLLEALGGGGVASFTGVVRSEGDLAALELHHYPSMTQPQVERIVDEATSRWPLLGVRVVHRYGRLEPGERIVFVGTAARHRAAALESCAFLIDWLKSEAPFWKKEYFLDGHSAWVEAKADDEARVRKWGR